MSVNGADSEDKEEIPHEEFPFEGGIDLSSGSKFDIVIGHIEDILVDYSFQKLQQTFLDKYYMEFDDCEENKLIYMPIFQEYISLLENHINSKLKDLMPDFKMDELFNELSARRGYLDGEVFEMLFTLSDFIAFKEMMLDFKAAKEGKTVDFSKDLTVTAINTETFCQDMEPLFYMQN